MNILNDPSTFLPFIPIGILGVFLLIQLYYIIFIYGRLVLHPVASNDTDSPLLPPLSVIISAYNEEENLRNFLPAILKQDYPEFEVIVIDDCSNDETKWVLKELKNQFKHLRIIEIEEHIRLKHCKKFTVTMGVKGAKYEHMVFTDADCEPGTSLWLRKMAAGFMDEKEIVLGYSPYYRRKGFLNKLIRFETSYTAISYLSYALKRNPYMGVGRNLAYTKSLFFKGKGFTRHMHIKSGDDDLFVNDNATRYNTAIAFHPDTHVYSVPKTTWNSYYKQKSRHAGASVLYKKRHQYSLGLQLLTALFFYLMIGICIALSPDFWPMILGAYLIRLTAQYAVYIPNFRKLRTSDLLIWFPFLDFAYYFFICYNGVFNRRKKQTTWK